MLANDIPATPPAPQRPALSAASQEAVDKAERQAFHRLMEWGEECYAGTFAFPEEDCAVDADGEMALWSVLDMLTAPLVARLATLEAENEMLTREAKYLSDLLSGNTQQSERYPT